MVIALLAALMNVPPLPPPPPEQIAAAAQALAAGPVPDELSARAWDGAIASAVNNLSWRTANSGYAPVLRARLAGRVADAGAAAAFNGCVTFAVARGYSAEDLAAVSRVVATPGGQVLWRAVLAAPVERCARETLGTLLLGGWGRSMQWLAGAAVTGELPAHDAARDGPAAWATRLIAFCGPATQGALVERSGRLLIREEWAKPEQHSAAYDCLIHSARLGGDDLNLALADGSTATLIF